MAPVDKEGSAAMARKAVHSARPISSDFNALCSWSLLTTFDKRPISAAGSSTGGRRLAPCSSRDIAVAGSRLPVLATAAVLQIELGESWFATDELSRFLTDCPSHCICGFPFRHQPAGCLLDMVLQAAGKLAPWQPGRYGRQELDNDCTGITQELPPRPVEPGIERHRNARKPKTQIESDGSGLVVWRSVGRFPRTFWEDDYLAAHSRCLYSVGNQ